MHLSDEELTVKSKARTQALLPLPQLALLAAVLLEPVLLSSAAGGPGPHGSIMASCALLQVEMVFSCLALPT